MDDDNDVDQLDVDTKKNDEVSDSEKIFTAEERKNRLAETICKNGDDFYL